MIDTRALLLKVWKNFKQEIIGTAGFSAHAIPIAHGAGQTDLIDDQLQLEHLLIEASGVGSPVEAAAQQQYGQPPPL